MNKILIPKITFKETIPDERRLMTAYSRIFEIARRNILAKRVLTDSLSQKYHEVHE